MWENFAQLAAQYYVSARFAAQAGFMPLCGNLAHHAVELQLKCGLIKIGAVVGSDQIPIRARLWLRLRRALAKLRLGRKPPEALDRYLQKRYGHSLKRLWRDFKASHPNAQLDQFDRLITDLDRWEEIRYPRRGIAMSVGLAPASGSHGARGPSMRGVRTYDLQFDQVDSFMQAVWSLSSINPDVFKVWVRAEDFPLVASAYEDDNVHLIYR